MAEFTIPAENVGLEGQTSTETDVRIGLERPVPTGSEVMPCFRVGADEDDFDVETFEGTLGANPLVGELDGLDRISDEMLYAIEWEWITGSLIRGTAKSEGTIPEGWGSGGR